MRTFPLFCVLLAVHLLAGCESLQIPWQREPETVEPAVASGAPEEVGESAQCPEPVEVVCTEPEVKVVERVIERRVEKVVEVPVAKDKLVLGTVETVSVEPGGLSLDALIDTGSSTCSLITRELTPFERDGKEWVRFRPLPSDKGDEHEPVTIELPVKRYMRVVRPGFESQRRPVVAMNLTIGDVTHMVEVNLTDRGNPNFPLLIGRNFLKDTAVVDVSRRYVQGVPKIRDGK